MQNALKQLDLLSEPVSFHIDNQKTFKTVFGGVLSIISLAIVVFFLHSSFENCLNKSVVDTKSNKKYNIDPTPIVFNKNKFMFAIGIR